MSKSDEVMDLIESSMVYNTINEDKFSDSCNKILSTFKNLEPNKQKIELIVNNLKGGGFKKMTSKQYTGVMFDILDYLDQMDNTLADVRKLIASDSMSFNNSGYKK